MPISRDHIPTNPSVLTDIPIYELFLLRRMSSGMAHTLPEQDFVAMILPCQVAGHQGRTLLLYEADNGQAGWNSLEQGGRVSQHYDYRFIRYLNPEEGITIRGSGTAEE